MPGGLELPRMGDSNEVFDLEGTPSPLRETLQEGTFAPAALDSGDMNQEDACIVARELINMSHEDLDSQHAFSEWRIVLQVMDPDTAENIRNLKRARTLTTVILAVLSVALHKHYEDHPQQVDGFGPVNTTYCTVVAWVGLALTLLGIGALSYFYWYSMYLVDTRHRLPQHYWLAMLLFTSGVLWTMQYTVRLYHTFPGGEEYCDWEAQWDQRLCIVYA